MNISRTTLVELTNLRTKINLQSEMSSSNKLILNFYYIQSWIFSKNLHSMLHTAITSFFKTDWNKQNRLYANWVSNNTFRIKFNSIIWNVSWIYRWMLLILKMRKKSSRNIKIIRYSLGQNYLNKWERQSKLKTNRFLKQVKKIMLNNLRHK